MLGLSMRLRRLPLLIYPVGARLYSKSRILHGFWPEEVVVFPRWSPAVLCTVVVYGKRNLVEDGLAAVFSLSRRRPVCVSCCSRVSRAIKGIEGSSC